MQEMENVGADTGSQDSSESSSPEDTTMGGMGGSAQTGDAASGKAKAVVEPPPPTSQATSDAEPLSEDGEDEIDMDDLPDEDTVAPNKIAASKRYVVPLA